MLVDSFGRAINYLRLSVTDRCNLRCSYCMPAEGVAQVAHADILSYEELFLLAQAAVSLGVEKIRITGGEPLVRKGILEFLQRLCGLPGLRQLVLTTNGVLLDDMAVSLRAAGVQRLNVSLDSLDAATFARITRCGELRQVLSGIQAAERTGLALKLNMVVMRGVNDHEVVDFARMTLTRGIAVRYIEYMPVIREPGWQSLVVPGEEILARLSREFAFDCLPNARLAGPAQNYRIAGARGTFGIITPLTGHFCGACNRIRVTASGKARSCLFSEQEMNLRPFLRSQNLSLLKVALRRVVKGKPGMHGLSREGADHQPFAMSSVGG